MSRRIAIIGGGPAGLGALHQLLRSGADAHLFDPTPGGLLRTVHEGEWIAEAGAHSIASPDVLAMLAGVADAPAPLRVAAEARRRFVLFRGAPQPVPMSAGELVASPLLSVAGRLRLLKEPFIPARGHDDEAIDAFARRRFGSQVAERMLDPIVSSSTGGDPHALLARALFPRHVEFERSGGSVLRGAMRAGMQARRHASRATSGAWSFPGGIEQLAGVILRAAEPARVQRRAVDAVALRSDGVVVTAGDAEHRFDAAVLAVTPAALRRMALTGLDASALATLLTMPHASVITVSLGFRRDQLAHALDGASLLVPSSARRHVLTTFFASTMFPGRAPAEHVLLTSIAGGVRFPELVDASDDAIVAMVRGELAAPLGLTGNPVFVHVERWHDAMPQPVGGHFGRLAAVDQLEAAEARVAFAGGWRAGMNVGEAMLSGVRAAIRVETR